MEPEIRRIARVDGFAIALMLVTTSTVFSMVAGVAAGLAGLAQGIDAVYFTTLSPGWLAGAALVVRGVRRRRSSGPCPSAAHLLMAATASFIVALGLGVSTASWQDLMSEPRPTPLMVVKDLTSVLAPLLAALITAWLVLSARQSG
jgi:hypothetical protein